MQKGTISFPEVVPFVFYRKEGAAFKAVKEMRVLQFHTRQ